MDHSKVNQHHHSPNSHYGSTTHPLTSPIHNSLQLNLNSNFNSHNYQSDMNPLATSVNSIFGSSVLPQPNDGILDLESGIGWCTNCNKQNDRHLPEQGTFIRSKSLDDLNSLTLQEDHHHHHHNHHHHHHHNHNHLQNQLNSSIVREDHHRINHHHPHPHPHHHVTNENGIFNQPMLSSTNCDIENVLQKISRLEM